MRLAVACFVLLALYAPVARAAAGPPVKKSEQGICHERGSGSYKTTKHFESFDTLEACVASGGRVARNARAEGEDSDQGPGSVSSGRIGGKIAMIVGMLIIVGAAFWLSRRGSQRSLAAVQDELERKKWEGHKLD